MTIDGEPPKHHTGHDLKAPEHSCQLLERVFCRSLDGLHLGWPRPAALSVYLCMSVYMQEQGSARGLIHCSQWQQPIFQRES